MVIVIVIGMEREMEERVEVMVGMVTEDMVIGMVGYVVEKVGKVGEVVGMEGKGEGRARKGGGDSKIGGSGKVGGYEM